MGEMIKGNYKIDEKKIPKGNAPSEEKDETELKLEDYEKKATEKLGGSIAFVLKNGLKK